MVQFFDSVYMVHFYESAGHVLLCFHYVALSRCPVPTSTRLQGGQVHYTCSRRGIIWPQSLLFTCF